MFIWSYLYSVTALKSQSYCCHLRDEKLEIKSLAKSLVYLIWNELKQKRKSGTCLRTEAMARSDPFQGCSSSVDTEPANQQYREYSHPYTRIQGEDMVPHTMCLEFSSKCGVGCPFEVEEWSDCGLSPLFTTGWQTGSISPQDLSIRLVQK